MMGGVGWSIEFVEFFFLVFFCNVFFFLKKCFLVWLVMDSISRNIVA